MLVSIGRAAKEAGVTVATLRLWDNAGKIISHRTQGGHRRYELESVLTYANRNKTSERITVIYARVCSYDKITDLEMQKQLLQLFCASKGWKFKIIEDISSAIDYQRPGLLELIKLIESNMVERILLNYGDRLLGFGSEILLEICKCHNVEVITLNQDDEKHHDKELVDDMLSVLCSISAKLYGNKINKSRFIMEEIKSLLLKEIDKAENRSKEA
jgi:putative resolvase